jgi:hypothetical protein
MKSKKIVLLLILSIAGVCFIVPRIITADKLNEESMLNSEYCYNEKFNMEDSALFNSFGLKKMNLILVLKSNYRNPIKCYDYNNQGKLYLTKIDLTSDIPIDKFILFREVPSSETNMHSYSNFSLGNQFDFLILGEKTAKVNKVIFSLTGDGMLIHKNVFNKNFVSYYLPVSTFSLRYDENAPTDIFFGGKETLFGGRDTYPLMISFYKKKNSLYVLILIPNKNEMNLKGDLLGKIMNDNTRM